MRAQETVMKFGLNALLYTAEFSKDQLGLISKVAEMGYDGVEIPVNDLGILDPAATNAAREAAGMGLTSCAVLLPGANLASEDPAERQAGIALPNRRIERVPDAELLTALFVPAPCGDEARRLRIDADTGLRRQPKLLGEVREPVHAHEFGQLPEIVLFDRHEWPTYCRSRAMIGLTLRLSSSWS